MNNLTINDHTNTLKVKNQNVARLWFTTIVPNIRTPKDSEEQQQLKNWESEKIERIFAERTMREALVYLGGVKAADVKYEVVTATLEKSSKSGFHFHVTWRVIYRKEPHHRVYLDYPKFKEIVLDIFDSQSVKIMHRSVIDALYNFSQYSNKNTPLSTLQNNVEI